MKAVIVYLFPGMVPKSSSFTLTRYRLVIEMTLHTQTHYNIDFLSFLIWHIISKWHHISPASHSGQQSKDAYLEDFMPQAPSIFVTFLLPLHFFSLTCIRYWCCRHAAVFLRSPVRNNINTASFSNHRINFAKKRKKIKTLLLLLKSIPPHASWRMEDRAPLRL